jgi:hypothetical protein
VCKATALLRISLVCLPLVKIFKSLSQGSSIGLTSINLSNNQVTSKALRTSSLLECLDKSKITFIDLSTNLLCDAAANNVQDIAFAACSSQMNPKKCIGCSSFGKYGRADQEN